MNMQVRHALADPVVDGYEGPVRGRRSHHGSIEELHIREQRKNQVRRKIGESLMVRLGRHENVPRKERSVVKKSEGLVVFEDDIGFHRALRD